VPFQNWGTRILSRLSERRKLRARRRAWEHKYLHYGFWRVTLHFMEHLCNTHLNVAATGTAMVKCELDKTHSTMKVGLTLCLPAFARNLITVAKVTKANRFAVFANQYVPIPESVPQRHVIGRFKATKILYTFIHPSHLETAAF
jgi:hypothetical protein